MSEVLRLFVSATRDLEEHRALIGHILAELPVEVGAEIRRSSAGGVNYDDLYELIANCDRFYFLLGQDITAPAGAEWNLAWKLERSVLALRRAGTTTPAAQEFLRHSLPLKWTSFRDSAELARIVALDLIDLLLNPSNRYGLTVFEIERLQMRRHQIAAGGTPDFGEAGGAEGGGVILDNARREPMSGTLLDESTL